MAVETRANKSENGVSPVIGVMLMLVVTIVIAAVVAAFASGAISTVNKYPTIMFDAEYSQSNGLTLTCIGTTENGVTLNDVTIRFYGVDGSDKYITLTDFSRFNPGDSIQISQNTLKGTFEKQYGTSPSFTLAAWVPFYQVSQQGHSSVIELRANDDTLIGSAKAVITA